MTRSRLLVTVAMALALVGAGSAVAPPAGSLTGALPTLTIDPGTVAPGDTITISGTGCTAEPGLTPMVELIAFPFGDTSGHWVLPPNVDGSWSVSVQALPMGPHGGDAPVGAQCQQYDSPFPSSPVSHLDYAPATVHVTPSGAATVSPTTVHEGDSVTITGPDCTRLQVTTGDVVQSVTGTQFTYVVPAGTAGSVVQVGLACLDPLFDGVRYTYDPVQITVLPSDTPDTTGGSVGPNTLVGATVPTATSATGESGTTTSTTSTTSAAAVPVAAPATFTG